jgi:hypothetical protein
MTFGRLLRLLADPANRGLAINTKAAVATMTATAENVAR